MNGLGDGDVTGRSTGPGLEPGPAARRAQRHRDGRVYRIAVTVTDEFGLSCTGTVRVGVPHEGARTGRLGSAELQLAAALVSATGRRTRGLRGALSFARTRRA